MSPTAPTKIVAIGYMRVSTPHQLDNLDAQGQLLREMANQFGLDVPEIYEDVGSAHATHAIDDLKGLQSALKRAQEAGGVVCIKDASRLSRNLAAYREHIAPLRLRFFSLNHAKILFDKDLENAIKHAEAEADEIARKTRVALSGRNKVTLDKTEMRRLAMKGVERRRLAKEEDIIVGKGILREFPNITARQFGEKLIEAGRKPPRGHSFILDTARKRLNATKEAIALEDENEELDFLEVEVPAFADFSAEQISTQVVPSDTACLERHRAVESLHKLTLAEDRESDAAVPEGDSTTCSRIWISPARDRRGHGHSILPCTWQCRPFDELRPNRAHQEAPHSAKGAPSASPPLGSRIVQPRGRPALLSAPSVGARKASAQGVAAAPMAPPNRYGPGAFHVSPLPGTL